ncbi:hypothetical protein GOBAR_DD26318 [Gossypium barbadense]|nr:hypothetical protein GOBAR_DD26318 [Gossypium barbadense]
MGNPVLYALELTIFLVFPTNAKRGSGIREAASTRGWAERHGVALATRDCSRSYPAESGSKLRVKLPGGRGQKLKPANSSLEVATRTTLLVPLQWKETMEKQHKKHASAFLILPF